MTTFTRPTSTAQTWATHVYAYSESETTWRKSTEERACDWADGRCGYCGLLPEEHRVTVPLTLQSLADTAAAVLTDQETGR